MKSHGFLGPGMTMSGPAAHIDEKNKKSGILIFPIFYSFREGSCQNQFS